ncbi:MAG: hypothetical protein PHQ53_05400 [Candidatus Krumholzibacteria bacterium]|nr:hypothetical protein [Candidatus Krumholzibacteria bacterium]
MFRRFLLGIMVVSLASLAWANVPDPDNSTAVTASPGAAMTVLPNAGGMAFTQARLGGAVVDATITLTLLDESMNPVFGYPFDDIWLESSAGGLVYCTRGTTPDGSTDINGVTTWTTPLAAGGCTDGEDIVVMVAGTQLTATIDLTFISADFSSNLIVNTLDVSPFSALFFSGSYEICADMDLNGSVNSLDIPIMAAAVFGGVECIGK